MTEKVLKQKAEDFIIDRYKIAECYREDNEETREYMRMDVHSQYEEEYQLYLDATKELEKQLKAEHTRGEIDFVNMHCNSSCKKVKELETQIVKLTKELDEIMQNCRNVTCNTNESKTVRLLGLIAEMVLYRRS